MRELVRGQRIKLSELFSSSSFKISLRIDGALGQIFDFSCFSLNENGFMDESFFVYYKQPELPNRSIKLFEDDSSNCKIIEIFLLKLPLEINKLVLAVSLDGAGDFSSISSGLLEIICNETVVATHSFSGSDFNGETSLLLAEVYRLREEWRFSIIGQGFIGKKLDYLVQYFNGTVLEETPAIDSNSLLNVIEKAKNLSRDNQIQKLIDQTILGGILKLGKSFTSMEIAGPLVFSKAIEVQGGNVTLWSSISPVLAIESAGVIIRDMNIEFTGENVPIGEDYAIVATADCSFKNVCVRGRVIGIGGEDEQWVYPSKLSFGSLYANVSYEFILNLSTPVSCCLSTTIKDLTISPEFLPPGHHEVRLFLSKNWGSKNTTIFGKILLSSQNFVRFILVDGFISPEEETDVGRLCVRKILS